jgi:hypothetical protein
MVEALGYARGLGHGFVAGAGALTLELHVDDRLNGVEAEALPAILDLDVGQSEAVLQRAGHLHRHRVSMASPRGRSHGETHLGDLGPPQDFAGDVVLFGHGGGGGAGGAHGGDRG